MAIQQIRRNEVGTTAPARWTYRGSVYAARFLLLAVFLACWQFLPEISAVGSRVRFLDPLFISSPRAVVMATVHLLLGNGGRPLVWPYLWRTMQATLLGGAGGVVVGALGGLLLSGSRWWNSVFRPYVVAINSIPRIALVPIIILIAGPTVEATAISAGLVVVFIVFFNAYEGGRSIRPAVIENVALLGGTSSQIMWRVRARYVFVWTLAALPNAISFALVGVVTTEVIGGVQGIGYLILNGITSLDAGLIFGVSIILCIIGVALLAIGEGIARVSSHGVDVGRMG